MQVSKTAPTGEYLTTGSFMIRGKKNYLPPTTLTYGFGFIFKLEEGSIERHKGERVPKIEQPTDLSHQDTQSIGVDAASDSASVNDATEKTDDQILERSALDVFMDASVDDLSSHPVDRSNRDSSHMTTTVVGENAMTAPPQQSQHHSHDSGLKTGSTLGSKAMAKMDEIGRQEVKTKASVSKQTVKNRKKGKQDAWDEEDIQLMSSLLQSAGPKKTRSQRREERKKKKADKRAAVVASHGIQSTEEEIKDVISKATEVPFASEAISDDEDPLEGVDDVVSEVDPEEQELDTLTAETHQLDALTGQPHTDDTLLYAMPICAPYECLIHCRYKVKLLPGTLKKGKAGKQCAQLLTHGKDIPLRDLQLMKAVTDPEIANVMIGSVKLSMPGMQKIKQKKGR